MKLPELDIGEKVDIRTLYIHGKFLANQQAQRARTDYTCKH